MLLFLWGAITVTCAVAALFFLRFWRDTHDRFFALLSASFLVLGLNYLSLALWVSTDETRHLVYIGRLVAFGLILVGIVDKNLRPER